VELIDEYKIGAPEKLEVVPLGIDLDTFQSVGEVDLDQTRMQRDHELVIGWIGRLTGVKNPIFFVDLAAVLKSTETQAKFIIVGDGHLRQAVEARI
jgi:glycosyltransferase involved in cell wall biosynthesis